jgi:hypothetical protein
MDANLEFQQRLAGLPLGVLVIHARSNRMADLEPLVPFVLAALNDLGPGDAARDTVPVTRGAIRMGCPLCHAASRAPNTAIGLD